MGLNVKTFKMKRALGEMRIEGVKTTAPLHSVILENEDFVSGKYTTKLLCKSDIREKAMERE